MSNEKITDPAAQTAEGDRYYNGDGVEKDFAQAAVWYEKAAKQGYAEGQYFLGYCYYAGEGVEQDFTKAAELYIKAAEQGHPRAQQKLSSCYYQAEGVEKDNEKAFYWCKKAAEQGRPFAQFMTGMLYYNGEGTEQDLEQAVHWFTKGAELNDDSAQCMLGLCCYNGTCLEQDYKKAFELWVKSAEQDNFQAQYYLGDCYTDGEGAEKDLCKAFSWYEKSAEQGFSLAQHKLAFRYLNGDGVECDADKAIYWYTQSAEQGYVKAQYSLGICYSRGEGVETDFEKAVYWLTKAAEQGDADSCIELAEIYNKGENVEFDFEKGAYWFKKAAETGHPMAMLSFGEWLLGEAIRPQERSEAFQWITDKTEGFKWLIKAAYDDDHDDDEARWQARWILAEIFEYGLYETKKDLETAKLWYERLVEMGDESAAVYVKLMEQKKEDPINSRGWERKHLTARILAKDFPDFDAVSSLHEKEPNYEDVEFTNEEKDECLPIAERILDLADLANRENILAFAGIAEKEEDAYFKTALKMAAGGIRADLFDEVIKVLFVKERPQGAALLSRFIIHRGIYLIIRGDFTVQKLKVLLGSLYVPRLLLAKPGGEDRKFKMTFNYLLTHREIPRLYFESLNDFYQKVLPDPEMMQRFLFFAYNRAVFFSNENPEIEPPFEVEKFDMYMYKETQERNVIVITLPKCDTPPESYQIAIPTARQRAGYYTCELSVNPMTNTPCFILGEWTSENKHNNYGMIEMTSETSFAQSVVEIAYGKPLKEPPFDPKNRVFDTPTLELYCDNCGTTNYFYDDNEPPYLCDNCGTELDEEEDDYEDED